jgi:hypothetical protein
MFDDAQQTAQEAHDTEREAEEEWFLIQAAQEMDAEAGWLRAAETHPEDGWDGTP